MASNLLGSEVGPSGEVATVECGTPTGETGGGEERCVVEGDAASDGGVRCEERVDAMRCLMMGDADWGLLGLARREVDSPQVCDC